MQYIEGIGEVSMTKPSLGTSQEDLEQLTSLFRILSDKTRLTIVMLLSQGERNVSSLCGELGLPQPTVSHHLGLLRTNHVVASRRDGKQVYYVLNGKENAAAGGLSFPLLFSASRFTVSVTEQSE
jgi:DNA-binding transcriptional ArsR family regulator